MVCFFKSAFCPFIFGNIQFKDIFYMIFVQEINWDYFINVGFNFDKPFFFVNYA